MCMFVSIVEGSISTVLAILEDGVVLLGSSLRCI